MISFGRDDVLMDSRIKALDTSVKLVHTSALVTVARIGSPNQNVSAVGLQFVGGHSVGLDDRGLKPLLCHFEINITLRGCVVGDFDRTAVASVHKN